MKYLIFLLLSLISLTGSSQTKDSYSFCGTEASDEQLAKEKEIVQNIRVFTKQFTANFSAANITSIPDIVPVKVHNIRRSDGSGSIDINALNTGIAHLNDIFLPANIQFELCEGINYIDSDEYYNYVNENHRETLLRPNMMPNVLNFFYAGTVSFDNRTVGGLASSLDRYNRYFIATTAHAADSELIPHEVGHIFGLYHTHGKFNFDISESRCSNNDTSFPDEVWCGGAVQFYNNNTDINNDGIIDCEQTGDNVCDTPADPWLLDKTSNCTYTGNSTDYYGLTYSPDVTNIMSYASSCRTRFTVGQYARIRYWYENYILYTACNGCSNLTTRTVINTNDSGIGSLRWAVDCINGQSTKVSINFNISGSGDKIIYLQNPLPNLTTPIVIDGSTQANGKIIIDGSQLTTDSDDGLRILAEDCEIYGLTIQNFPDEGIQLEADYAKIGVSNKGNVITQNGRLSDFGDGILVWQSNHSEIIGNTISKNRHGLLVGNNSKFITIGNNTIGNTIETNRDDGIYVYDGASQITIENNLIDGNGTNTDYGDGIVLSEIDSIYLYGNSIINNRIGILIKNCAEIAVGKASNTFSNHISGNSQNGIYLYEGSNHCLIENNLIGLNTTGTAKQSNGYNGIFTTNVENITIKSNVIAGSGFQGIYVYLNSNNLTIQNNKIGSDITGTVAIPNGQYGILVRASTNITVGGDNQGNLLFGNTRDGIYVYENSQNCKISQNSIACNQRGIYIASNSNNNPSIPTITTATTSSITGNGPSYAQIEVFIGDYCGGSNCQGKTYLGTATANATGNWTLAIPYENEAYNGVAVLATATIGNRTSAFSNCRTLTGNNDYSCAAHTMYLANNPITPRTYQAATKIESTGRIGANTTVHFKANEAIILKAGFHAQNGAIFTAVIEACNGANLDEDNGVGERLSLATETDVGEALAVKVYPNPVYDLLTIEVDKAEVGFELELFDLMGRKVYQQRFLENFGQVEINVLEEGIYFLRIDAEITKKIIINQ